jgi:hypothetical protein
VAYLRYYPDFYLEGLSKITETLSQEPRYPAEIQIEHPPNTRQEPYRYADLFGSLFIATSETLSLIGREGPSFHLWAPVAMV